MTDEKSTELPPEPAPSGSSSGRNELPPLHWGVRLGVLLFGGVVTVIGIAGLVLPGIQGILTIVVGLAILSLASELVHRTLHRLLGRWPEARRRMDRLRERLHDWLSPGSGKARHDD